MDLLVISQSLRTPVVSPALWRTQALSLLAPTKRITVLSLTGLGDLPLHLYRTMHKQLVV